jgi:hypothetical protein
LPGILCSNSEVACAIDVSMQVASSPPPLFPQGSLSFCSPSLWCRHERCFATRACHSWRRTRQPHWPRWASRPLQHPHLEPLTVRPGQARPGRRMGDLRGTCNLLLSPQCPVKDSKCLCSLKVQTLDICTQRHSLSTVWVCTISIRPDVTAMPWLTRLTAARASVPGPRRAGARERGGAPDGRARGSARRACGSRPGG